MLGTENVSSVPLEQFGERFALYPTLGKLANIAAEVGEIDRVAEGILKSFTTGDAIQFDRKHRDPITAQPSAKLVFASNNRPRFSDKSGGLWRRMIVMPWQVVIPESDRVKGMDTPDWWRDQGELPGILNWAIAGLFRLERQGFTKSSVCEKAIAEYRTESNPARMFLEDSYSFSPDGFEPCESVYEAYTDWSTKNGFMRMSATNLGLEIRRKFPQVERKQKQAAGERFWAYFGLIKAS
jgi:P4 family phage/plasmid primase-like protien